jgi:hypothetical protein
MEIPNRAIIVECLYLDQVTRSEKYLIGLIKILTKSAGLDGRVNHEFVHILSVFLWNVANLSCCFFVRLRSPDHLCSAPRLHHTAGVFVHVRLPILLEMPPNGAVLSDRGHDPIVDRPSR